jgi:Leucine-rich repeat (LRR) protein
MTSFRNLYLPYLFSFLRDLDLKANSIRGPLTQEKLPKIETLETLSLDKNLFTSVQSEAFINFPNLITLSLKNNQIDVLQDHAFNGLNSLQKLDLGHNGIVTVSGGSLMHLSRVVMLDFSHNFLR